MCIHRHVRGNVTGSVFTPQAWRLVQNGVPVRPVSIAQVFRATSVDKKYKNVDGNDSDADNVDDDNYIYSHISTPVLYEDHANDLRLVHTAMMLE